MPCGLLVSGSDVALLRMPDLDRELQRLQRGDDAEREVHGPRQCRGHHVVVADIDVLADKGQAVLGRYLSGKL